MKSLSVSSARSQLPSLLDDVFEKQETILISRKGKPVAQLSPIPLVAGQEEAARYPLRGVAIRIADDFDEPSPGLWETAAE
jgi:antitoxin (DNA-binding transcriptional repressor) of toxin-antitoxin stability system